MNTDALFQLGIVSVALNTSQTEEQHLDRPQRRHLRRPVRAAGMHLAFAPAAALRHPGSRASTEAPALHRHPMQDQFCHSRTPA